MVRVWKTKWLLFCLRYDPLIVFQRQNHVTFIFIKTMSHGLLVQMAYYRWLSCHHHVNDSSRLCHVSRRVCHRGMCLLRHLPIVVCIKKITLMWTCDAVILQACVDHVDHVFCLLFWSVEEKKKEKLNNVCVQAIIDSVCVLNWKS